MIILKLKGGLGNQLFQYAFGRHLSIKNNDTLKLDIQGLVHTSKDTGRDYLLNNFNTLNILAESEEIIRIKYPFKVFSKIIRFLNIKIFRKFYINFEPKLLNLKSDIYLDGFFQSELYFKDIEETLRKELTLKSPLSPTAQEFKDKIINTSIPVSLHVRRGDYISNAKTNQYHGTCGLDYYEKAIGYFKEKTNSPTFFIFSDDIQWVKENLKINNAVYVSNPNLTECEELILMSICSHHIIANSTFSWWGAWLNPNFDKIVLAPARWTNKKNLNKNILPSTWIKI